MTKVRKIRLHVPFDSINPIQLTHEQSHYLLKVMRCEDREKISIFNETLGEWLAELRLDKKNAFVYPIQLQREKEITRNSFINLCFAPTKKYGEFVFEKATEMSVDSIMPILSNRGVVRQIKMDRYKKL